MTNKPVLMVSFSGGRTSAYMSKRLKDEYSDSYDLVFVFMNTGLEAEETLAFVDACDKFFGLNVVWLEAVIHEQVGVGTTHKVVNFETACRDKSLFVDMCRAYGIPNVGFKHCTRELKTNVFDSYRKERYPGADRAIGIRIDEIDRMNSNADALGIKYPLVSWFPSTKQEILDWWAGQEFNLMIPEHYGNCKTCFKKSDRKLYTLVSERPEWFEDFAFIESDTKSIIATDARPKNSGKFFRKKRTTTDLFFNAYTHTPHGSTTRTSNLSPTSRTGAKQAANLSERITRK